MVCFRHGGAIICGRGAVRPSQKSGKPEIPICRYPGCGRRASQAGWGCRPHWFKLPPDLRARIWRSAQLAIATYGKLNAAWAAVAEEGDRWIAEQLAKPPKPRWREPELPL